MTENVAHLYREAMVHRQHPESPVWPWPACVDNPAPRTVLYVATERVVTCGRCLACSSGDPS